LIPRIDQHFHEVTFLGLITAIRVIFDFQSLPLFFSNTTHFLDFLLLINTVATLGIVEFFIFILHKYYAGLNVPMELVFADVHFTLFFTALFNALGCVVVAFFVCRHSKTLWVQPEYQDLHHYVEIREEFDRIEKRLEELKVNHEELVESIQHSAEMRRVRSSQRQSIATRVWEQTGGEMQHGYYSLKKIGNACVRFLRYPALTRKYNKLLVQIRFHELKFHFIQANNLPITMHVSDYLKRSELHVLMKMVHISTFAWLLLTAGINLVYFLMGVVVYTTDADEAAVGLSLTGMYFSANLFFVALSLIIWNKMTWIFNNIMHMKLISQTGQASLHDDNDSDNDKIIFSSSRSSEELDQKSLFWGGSPKYITIMIQFMQFGFAVALSVLLVFWGDIHDGNRNSGINGWYFLLCILTCYALFVYIISHVVPRFTLCSSIGQLVDQRRLHETLARHRLDEALRRREQALMEQEMEESYMNDETDDGFQGVALSANQTSPQPAILKAFQSFGSSTIPEFKPKHSASIKSSSTSMTPLLLKNLVSTDTKDLRSTLPEDEQQKLNEREQKLSERRKSRKTLSDGVEAMRNMVGIGADQNVTPADRRASRRDRRKSISASASIQMMRDFKQPAATVEGGEVLPVKAKDDSVILAEERAKRRASRKKTMSASADIRMMRLSTLHEDAGSGSLSSSMTKAAQTVPFSIIEGQPTSPAKTKMIPSALEVAKLDATQPPGNALFEKPFSIIEGQPSSPAKIQMIPSALEAAKLDVTQPPGKVFESSAESSLMESESELSTRDESIDKFGILTNVEMAVEQTKTDSGDGTRTKAESDDDYDEHSDADDLPEVQESDRQRKKVVPPPKRTVTDRARQYFRSRRYVVISAVFGTMICFFIVGMRLEAVMICTGVLPDGGNTWNFRPVVGFWMEFIWLTMFILTDIFILYLFRPSRIVDNRDRSSLVAAIIDLTICVTCFGLLVGAQTQRCCDYDTGEKLRLLAVAVVKDDEETSNCPASVECCPPFGERLYGGFGDVEMFTSLIALRLLRFLMSGFIIRRLDRKYGWSELLKSTRGVHDPSVDVNHPFDPLYERKGAGQSHGNGNLDDERGTVVELWKQALGLYPDIVQRHGEFSGELLMAMLGIEVMTPKVAAPTKSMEVESDDRSTDDDMPVNSPEKPGRRRSSAAMNNKRRTSLTIDMLGTPQSGAKTSRRKTIYGDSKYSVLTAEAQAFILAGKLGKPVRATKESQATWDGSSSLGNIFEDSASSLYAPSTGQAYGRQKVEVSFGESQPESGIRSTAMKPEFEVDAEFDDDEPAAQFFSPSARLIRSMRRCDRKLMPLLDKWAVVDVVMTKFEIVYFDASDVDDVEAQTNPTQHIKRMKAVRQAIVATKGGKGLRLRDVAFGRRVVGHQELKSFEDIHVERILPHESDVIQESEEEPHAADEFWKDCQKEHIENLDETSHPSRNSRWMRVKEDRLKLKTKHDTLYLRFYSDLDSFEHNTERMDDESEKEGDIFKDNALQWCQTIGRLIGAGHLKQDLPHFGDDDNDELRDYLLVVDADNDPSSEKVFGRFKKKVAHLQHHRRQRSEPLSGSETVAVSERAAATTHRMVKSERRSSSFQENSGMMAEALKRPHILRRAVSGGEDLESSSTRRARGFRRARSSGPDSDTSESGKRKSTGM
jgi:hypothetical protein